MEESPAWLQWLRNKGDIIDLDEIHDIKKIKEICWQKLYDFELQKQQIRSLQHIITDLSDR